MEKIKGDTMIFRLFEQYGRNIGSIDRHREVFIIKDQEKSKNNQIKSNLSDKHSISL